MKVEKNQNPLHRLKSYFSTQNFAKLLLKFLKKKTPIPQEALV
jgi:hypothetical protein